MPPDGSFSASIPIAPGENQIVVRIVSDNGEEVVECTLPLVGACTWPPCAVHPPELWFDEDCLQAPRRP